MKKHFILLISGCLIVILVIFLVQNKKQEKLNELLKSQEVGELYLYLGDAASDQDSGLTTYLLKEVSKENLSKEEKIAHAFYILKDNQKIKDNLKVTSSKDNQKICKVGGTSFQTTADECSIIKVAKKDIQEAYFQIYHENLEEINKFTPYYNQECKLEGEEYLCGEPITYSYTISSPITTYRLLTNLKETKEELILTDYFIKISDNKCYTSYDREEENTACTNALKTNPKIDGQFVEKYGTPYNHTFKKINFDQKEITAENYYYLKTTRK